MLLIQQGNRFIRLSEFRIDSYPTVEIARGVEATLDKEIRIQEQERRIQKLKDEGKIKCH